MLENNQINNINNNNQNGNNNQINNNNNIIEALNWDISNPSTYLNIANDYFQLKDFKKAVSGKFCKKKKPPRFFRGSRYSIWFICCKKRRSPYLSRPYHRSQSSSPPLRAERYREPFLRPRLRRSGECFSMRPKRSTYSRRDSSAR